MDTTTDAQFTIAAPTASFHHAALIAIVGGVVFFALPWVDHIMLFIRIAVFIVMSTR